MRHSERHLLTVQLAALVNAYIYNTDHLLLLSICRIMPWLCHGVCMTKQGEHE